MYKECYKKKLEKISRIATFSMLERLFQQNYKRKIGICKCSHLFTEIAGLFFFKGMHKIQADWNWPSCPELSRQRKHTTTKEPINPHPIKRTGKHFGSSFSDDTELYILTKDSTIPMDTQICY